VEKKYMSNAASFKEFRNKHGNDLASVRARITAKAKRAAYKGDRKGTDFNGLRMSYWKPTKDATPVVLVGRNMESLDPDDWFFENWQMSSKESGSFQVLQCNCYNGQKSLPCLPCYFGISDEDASLFPKRKDAISVNLLGDFHAVKKVSPKGTEYEVLTECGGLDKAGKNICTLCAEEHEKVTGIQKYWNLGAGHKTQLVDELKSKVINKCSGCGEGELDTARFSCPSCEAVIADKYLIDLTAEEEDMLRNHTVACPSCETEVRAVPSFACFHAEKKGRKIEFVPGCDNPAPTSPFDVILYISTTGSGPSTALVIDSFERLSKEEREEIGAEKFVTMPFEKFLGTMPLWMQASKLGRTNPFPAEDNELLKNAFPREVVAGDQVDVNSRPRS
jgi:hypothetical protein